MGVENLNAMMDLGIRVNIEAFHVSLDEERKHVFKQNSIQYHIVKPKASVEVFSSGKVIFTGLMTLGDMGASKDIVLEDLAKAGINPPGSPAIKVTNIVASGDLGMNLDLNELLLKLGCGKTEYEPEQFPGLICKLDDPQVTVLLFNSGKMICTGTSDANEAMRAADILWDRLNEIKNHRASPQPLIWLTSNSDDVSNRGYPARGRVTPSPVPAQYW